ncbi:MAG TPA: MBOAT family protein, partial [Candidatus Binatia bacterium]|nr:MBOAT family protein [Candidatus Binatia bacterium]
MVFNSLEFVVFAAVVFPLYFVLRSWTARTTWLLLASWLFYATWSPRFLLLLIATTWVDFHFARMIHHAVETGSEAGRRRGRRLVALSVAMNLGVLAFFKYGRFFWEQLALVMPLPAAPGWLSRVPPLGISFYTFHSISYVVDTYRRLRPPTLVFREFALYVAFFPQLIAGPIARWTQLGPQVQSPRRVTAGAVEEGLFRILKGLVKKVVLADSLGTLVDAVYGDVGAAAPVEIGLALYAYAFQIYFDFSGYTDMAFGLGRLLGFRLPPNFDHPYRAQSPREFWQRWHISLSTWLRDYLYIPLGGNRRGPLRSYLDLLATMTLGGLWHGAAWTFVLWGAFHGLWLVAHRLLVTLVRTPRTPAWLRLLVTFHLVVAAWVLFRAPSLSAVGAIASGLVASRPMSGPFPVGPALALLAGILSHAFAARVDVERWWVRAPRFVQGVAVAAVILLVGTFSAQS